MTLTCHGFFIRLGHDRQEFVLVECFAVKQRLSNGFNLVPLGLDQCLCALGGIFQHLLKSTLCFVKQETG